MLANFFFKRNSKAITLPNLALESPTAIIAENYKLASIAPSRNSKMPVTLVTEE